MQSRLLKHFFRTESHNFRLQISSQFTLLALHRPFAEMLRQRPHLPHGGRHLQQPRAARLGILLHQVPPLPAARLQGRREFIIDLSTFQIESCKELYWGRKYYFPWVA